MLDDIVGGIRRWINKKRWERWRAGQCGIREKTYFHCWDECGHVTDLYINYPIFHYRSGEPDCYGGSGKWKDALCLTNAIIRFARAGQSSEFYDVLSKCYWRRNSDYPEHCYMEIYGCNKPIYIAAVVNNSLSFGHAICAEHLGGDFQDFNNWKFFQYDNLDIKPGDWQMPYGTDVENTKVEINRVRVIFSCGGSMSGEDVVCFEIDKDGNVYLIECE